MGDPRIDGKRIRHLPVAGRKQISGCANGAIEMPTIVMVMMKSDRDAGDQIDQGYEDNKFLLIALQEIHFSDQQPLFGDESKFISSPVINNTIAST
jgi:hypothetical protein